MILNGREVEIHTVEIEAFQNKDERDGDKYYDENVIMVSWSGNIGFGEYALYTDSDGNWHGDSESMDRNDSKEFIRLLLDKFIENLEVDR